jgi:dihydroflavonol-4-reductase
VLEGTLRPLGVQPPLHRRRMDFFRKSFCFTMAEAHEAIGYAPSVDLGSGMAATARWYLERGFL